MASTRASKRPGREDLDAPGDEDPAPGQLVQGEGGDLDARGGHRDRSTGPLMRALPALVLAAAFTCGVSVRRDPRFDQKARWRIIEASEASFATGLKDWKRAEEHFAKAAALCPDTSSYWLNLGLALAPERPCRRPVRLRGRPPGLPRRLRAQSGGYGSVFGVYILVLLGEADQARSVLEKARARRPPRRPAPPGFIEKHGLENMIARIRRRRRTRPEAAPCTGTGSNF